MDDNEIRTARKCHWAASDANDFDAQHDIYRENAVIVYPQSGECISGRQNFRVSRVAPPSSKRFSVCRTVGTSDLRVTEFIIT